MPGPMWNRHAKPAYAGRRAWTGRDSSFITLGHKNPGAHDRNGCGVEALVSEVSQTIGFLRNPVPAWKTPMVSPFWGGEQPFDGIQAVQVFARDGPAVRRASWRAAIPRRSRRC